MLHGFLPSDPTDLDLRVGPCGVDGLDLLFPCGALFPDLTMSVAFRDELIEPWSDLTELEFVILGRKSLLLEYLLFVSTLVRFPFDDRLNAPFILFCSELAEHSSEFRHLSVARDLELCQQGWLFGMTAAGICSTDAGLMTGVSAEVTSIPSRVPSFPVSVSSIPSCLFMEHGCWSFMAMRLSVEQSLAICVSLCKLQVNKEQKNFNFFKI